MATSSSSTGDTITYALRDGVTWHDGTPFSADDVVFTFDTIAKNSLGINAQYLAELSSATSPDAKTVVLKFKSPQAFDPGLIVPILPKHIWSKMSPDQMAKFNNANPVGTGPTSSRSASRARWSRSRAMTPGGAPRPAAATVSWTVYTNDDVLAQALKTGDVDIVPQVPPTVFGGIQHDNSLTSVVLDSFSFHHIGINVWADPKARATRSCWTGTCARRSATRSTATRSRRSPTPVKPAR